MKKIDFCFHHSDHDGWASAAIVKADKNLSVGYGKQLQNSAILNMVTNKNVAIVDFSFPMETMKFIIKLAKSVLWIDHHLDSEPLKVLFSDPKVDGIHDMSKAGCLLTWEWFNPGIEPPICIKYIADRDIRAGQYEDALEYSYGLNTLSSLSDPLDNVWENLFNNEYLSDIMNAGITLRASFLNDAIWHARMRTNVVGEGDKQFILTNCTHMVSDMSDILIDLFKISIVLTWDMSNGLIKLHGRGKGCRDFFKPLLKGHPDAAGCSLPLKEGFEFINKLYERSRRVSPS